ncbi:MAG: hypothetical protein AAF497_03500 [Planctomycetota bacterium]
MYSPSRFCIVAILLLLVTPFANATLELSEVDLSTGMIEMTNVGTTTVTGTLLEWCIPFAYGPMESGGFSFAPGESRVYSIGGPILSSSDDLWIYQDRSGGFSNTATVISGIVWGSSQAGQGRVNSVVNNTGGEAWESNTDFIDISGIGAGQTIQLLFPGDNPNRSDGWTIDDENLGSFDAGVELCFDSDKDGDLDCADIDVLIAEIVAGTNNTAFDFTGDGLVDLDDRDAWLAEAASVNIGAPTYLLGDANLDGNVDVSDFNIWNSNKFQPNASWCNGDFNADGNVDVSDFNLWNTNKFQSASSAAVPEPYGLGLMVCGMAMLMVLRRR